MAFGPSNRGLTRTNDSEIVHEIKKTHFNAECDAHHRAAQQYMPTCPAETLNAFKATYSHFKRLETTFRWTINHCHQYKLDLMKFMGDYCERMGTPIIPAASTTTTVPTTLSVIDLARRMTREREEMMRSGKK